MGVDEVEAGRRAPVPEQPRFDVFGGQRFAEQRIVQEVDLSDRQVVRGTPVAVDLCESLACVAADAASTLVTISTSPFRSFTSNTIRASR